MGRKKTINFINQKLLKNDFKNPRKAMQLICMHTAASTPSLLQNFVAFYFNPKKLIIVVVFMVQGDNKT